MKNYKVTYRSSLIMFGNNVCTIIIEAENETEARNQIIFEGHGLRTIISVEEI